MGRTDKDNVLRRDGSGIGETDQKRRYLLQLTEQLQYHPIRQKIYREYEEHIDDETEYGMSMGMTRAEAVEAAVEQIGDPVETGKALDEIAAFLIEKETITGKEFMDIFHEVERREEQEAEEAAEAQAE